MAKPLFFVLDGPDGGGKSTQCRKLVERLRSDGRSVVACSDPGGTEVGTILRHLLLESSCALAPACEALLFMASRAQLVADVIRPALNAGQIVVSDRFLLANVVYQGHAGGLDVDALWRVGELAAQGIQPDRTFVLDLPLDLSMQRRKKSLDRLERRDFAYHQRVREGFLAEAQRRPEMIRVIDASLPPDVVAEHIWAGVSPLLTS
jgi:dTMP kinase